MNLLCQIFSLDFEVLGLPWTLRLFTSNDLETSSMQGLFLVSRQK